jgi:hypothetical protein
MSDLLFYELPARSTDNTTFVADFYRNRGFRTEVCTDARDVAKSFELEMPKVLVADVTFVTDPYYDSFCASRLITQPQPGLILLYPVQADVGSTLVMDRDTFLRSDAFVIRPHPTGKGTSQFTEQLIVTIGRLLFQMGISP